MHDVRTVSYSRQCWKAMEAAAIGFGLMVDWKIPSECYGLGLKQEVLGSSKKFTIFFVLLKYKFRALSMLIGTRWRRMDVNSKN